MKIDLAKYRDKRICVAVSGGRDSMSLLHYLYCNAGTYNIILSALNCDHKIRAQSANDSKFVKEWCESHEIPLLFFEWNSDLPKTEESARLWRRECYSLACVPDYEVCKPFLVCAKDGWRGADVVATAHHMNDNAETVLFNIARGSSLYGLTGITDGEKIIHPLIGVTRSEIENYISENAIPSVEDETNLTDGYTRNKIRHNVLPELEKAVPRAVNSIFRFSRLAAEDEEYFDGVIKDRELIEIIPYGVKIKYCAEKVIFKRAVVKYLSVSEVKDYTSEHLQRLYDLQFSDNGKRFEFLNLTAIKEYDGITICGNASFCEKDNEILLSVYIKQNSVIFGGQILRIVINDRSYNAEDVNNIKVLKFDRTALPDNAVIRFMQNGDKFTKFGGGTKKLADYFTDKKIPQRIRKKIPLIAVGSEIYAVCGVEISEKIKVCDNAEVSYIIAKDYIKE